MTLALGRLSSVPLREVWAHEAEDFTPWLALEYNLTLLAKTLGLSELQLLDTEVPVGDFRIDILARDVEGNLIVIENQFGPTDHKHLGQIMTYVAGQEGKATVVWLAENFREEHRAAIDWLNASTIEGFDFFAIEIQAFRIDNSVPAPQFSIVGKPNTWSRNLARTTRETADKPLDDRQKIYVSYWSAFGSFLEARKAPFKLRVPTPRDYWCGFGIGRSGFTLVATAGFRDHKLGVEIYIGHRAAKLVFDQFESERTAIEAEFGGPLDWQRMNDKKFCRIAVYRTDLDPNEQDQWPTQFDWFLDQMERFTQTFRPRIAALDLDQVDSSSDADSGSITGSRTESP
jgi:hypothetical protein